MSGWVSVGIRRCGRGAGGPPRAAHDIGDVAPELPGADVVLGAERTVGAGGDHAHDLARGLIGTGDLERVSPGIVHGGAQRCERRTRRTGMGSRPRDHAGERALHRRGELVAPRRGRGRDRGSDVHHGDRRGGARGDRHRDRRDESAAVRGGQHRRGAAHRRGLAGAESGRRGVLGHDDARGREAVAPPDLWSRQDGRARIGHEPEHAADLRRELGSRREALRRILREAAQHELRRPRAGCPAAWLDGAGGGSRRCIAMISPVPSASNGGGPVSSVNSTQPSE